MAAQGRATNRQRERGGGLDDVNLTRLTLGSKEVDTPNNCIDHRLDPLM